MKSTVETLSPTRVRLAIEVPFVELEPSLKKAYREIGQQIQIPGFRKGKVPPAIIDQRVGRGTVLNEAVQEAIPQNILAAVREHDLKTLGRPEVDITEFNDGDSLSFTAEVDVRPEITVPDLASLEVVVDELQVDDSEIDEQVKNLRERFATLKTVERAAAEGDYVQIDLRATVDGEEVPGGSASNISHEVGSKQLLPGLDEAVVGLAAGEDVTFTTQLVGGDFAGRDAEVLVTVRTVKEKELPELNDEFAQLASEFDTIEELRNDLRERVTRGKRVEQIYAARDKALEQLVEAAEVPAPEGVIRDEVESRKQAMVDQLERIGASMEDYLAAEEKTEEQIDAELTEAATQGVKVQLLLDTLADAEDVQVSDDEFGHEIVHRAQRAGMAPQQYYDQLVRSGAAGAVFGDVRRGKALASVMERITIKDTAGNEISLDALREASEAEHGHEH
ncbi:MULTISPECIES: trigger factor [Micromonospora]|uniref:Trigger factor n=2 Tax=Micromonospora TaxID=1873 RepID=A0A9X0LDD9_9ACTN|nr:MULTISPECIES: trigger factor [Micromonospora]AEB46794.1 trigger factor [Micromonospora maris AB-18-032]KUJ45971.1 trigger factor [Micromonospora maris]PMR57657.1 trigger factor [Verrucosispora sp. ts21]RUL89951.1 trigger factor [Verrucosispora sp. FIM060022]GIJ18999.1 trigger factor [Micromonospora gifhornensis]